MATGTGLETRLGLSPEQTVKIAIGKLIFDGWQSIPQVPWDSRTYPYD